MYSVDFTWCNAFSEDNNFRSVGSLLGTYEYVGVKEKIVNFNFTCT